MWLVILSATSAQPQMSSSRQQTDLAMQVQAHQINVGPLLMNLRMSVRTVIVAAECLEGSDQKEIAPQEMQNLCKAVKQRLDPREPKLASFFASIMKHLTGGDFKAMLVTWLDTEQSGYLPDHLMFLWMALVLQKEWVNAKFRTNTHKDKLIRVINEICFKILPLTHGTSAFNIVLMLQSVFPHSQVQDEVQLLLKDPEIYKRAQNLYLPVMPDLRVEYGSQKAPSALPQHFPEHEEAMDNKD
jgi:hypothetical protein